MDTPLFLDHQILVPGIEKLASGTKMQEDPSAWPVAIIKYAYKELPFLRMYEADLDLTQTDPVRGYALGKLLLYPPRITKEAAVAEKKLVVIPVIVRDSNLLPLDVFQHNNEMHPLSAEKIASILLRPQVMDYVSDKPATAAVIAGTTPPPDRRDYSSGSMSKVSSARLWHVALATTCPERVEHCKGILRENTGLRYAYASQEPLQGYLQDVLSWGPKEKTAAELRAVRQAMTVPTVVQVQADIFSNTFIIKTANHTCFAPEAVEGVSRFEVQKLMNSVNFETLLKDGRVTFTRQPVNPRQNIEKLASQASRLGVYNIWWGAEQHQAIVVPHMVDFEGNPMGRDLALFSGVHAMQEKIAGEYLYEAHMEPYTTPPERGVGCFAYYDGNMSVAFEPVQITGHIKVAMETGQKDEYWQATRMCTGEQLKVSWVTGLKKIAMMGDRLFVPREPGWVFLPLQGTQVLVRSTPDAREERMLKSASQHGVRLQCDEETRRFYLHGQNARLFTEPMDASEVEFALGALGLTDKQAKGLVKSAMAKGHAHAPMTRPVTLEVERVYTSLKKTAAARHVVPEFNTFAEVAMLCKVAALQDSVDTVLALNFVTPENVGRYVEYLPDFEKVSSQLAELLIASRIGFDQVKEASAKSTLTQISSLVTTLKRLKESIR